MLTPDEQQELRKSLGGKNAPKAKAKSKKVAVMKRPSRKAEAVEKDCGSDCSDEQGSDEPKPDDADDDDGLKNGPDRVLGCTRCRHTPKGCSQCRNPSYMPRGGRGRGARKNCGARGTGRKGGRGK